MIWWFVNRPSLLIIEFWPTYPQPISKRSFAVNSWYATEKSRSDVNTLQSPKRIFSFLFPSPLFVFWSHFSCKALRQLKLSQKRFFWEKDSSDEPLRVLGSVWKRNHFPKNLKITLRLYTLIFKNILFSTVDLISRYVGLFWRKIDM